MYNKFKEALLKATTKEHGEMRLWKI